MLADQVALNACLLPVIRCQVIPLHAILGLVEPEGPNSIAARFPRAIVPGDALVGGDKTFFGRRGVGRHGSRYLRIGQEIGQTLGIALCKTSEAQAGRAGCGLHAASLSVRLVFGMWSA